MSKVDNFGETVDWWGRTVNTTGEMVDKLEKMVVISTEMVWQRSLFEKLS